MKKVQLNLSQVADEPSRLFDAFVRAARDQGFSLEYVEMIFERVLLSNYKELNKLLQQYIEPISE